MSKNYKRVIELDNPVGYWRLGELTGTTCTDSVSGGTNHTYQNTPSLGQKGLVFDADKSVKFNGSNQYISTSNGFFATLLNGSSAVSFEFWTTGNTTNGRFVNSYINNAAAFVDILLINNTVRFSGRSVSTDSYQSGDTYIYNNKEITHVVGIFDYVNDAIIVYLNGKYTGSKSVTFNNTSVTAGVFDRQDSIARHTGTGNYCDGYFDEFAVYDYALTPNQIKKHYQEGLVYEPIESVSQRKLKPIPTFAESGKTKNYQRVIEFDNPVHWWRMNSDGVSTEIDVIGSADLSGEFGTPRTGPGVVFSADASMYYNGGSYNYRPEPGGLRNSDSSGSLELWFKPVNRNNGCMWSESTNGSNTTWIELSWENGYVYVQRRNSNNTVAKIRTINTFSIQKPHHAVLLSDGSTYSIYIDGKKQTLQILTGVNDGDWFADLGTNSVSIGALQLSTDTRFFNGYVDEVAYYDYQLSEGQILNHYKEGSAPSTDIVLESFHNSVNKSPAKFYSVVYEADKPNPSKEQIIKGLNAWNQPAAKAYTRTITSLNDGENTIDVKNITLDKKYKASLYWTDGKFESNTFVTPEFPVGIDNYAKRMENDGAISVWRMNEQSGIDSNDIRVISFERVASDGDLNMLVGSGAFDRGNPQKVSSPAKFASSSVEFDGSGDYFEGNSSSDFWLSGTHSFEVWVYQTARSGRQGLFAFADDSVSNKGYYFCIESDGDIRVYYAGETTLTSNDPANRVNLNEWTHIAFGASDGICRGYINGVKVIEGAFTIDVSGGFSASFKIGSNPSENGNWFTGNMNWMRLNDGTNLFPEEFTPLERGPYAAVDFVGNYDMMSYNNLNTQNSRSLNADGQPSVFFPGNSEGNSLYIKETSNYRASDSAGSIEAWIASASRQTIGLIWATSAWPTTGHWALLEHSNGNLRWRVNGSLEPENVITATSGPNVSNGRTHHVVVTSNGSTTKLYVDGLEVTTSGTNTGVWLHDMSGDTTDNISIGALFRNGSIYGDFRGNIANVAYYNSALSADQVKEHFAEGKYLGFDKEVMLDKPVDYWRFQETKITGTTYNDNFTTFDDNLWWQHTSGPAIDYGTFVSTDNKLQMYCESDGSQTGLNYILAKEAMVGDFDISVTYDNFSQTAALGSYLLLTINIGGLLYDVGLVIASDGPETKYFRWNYNGSNNQVSRTNLDGRVRLTRVGTTLTAYTDDDAGSWTTRTSTTVATTPARIDLRVWSFNSASGQTNVQIDNMTAVADSWTPALSLSEFHEGSSAYTLFKLKNVTRETGLIDTHCLTFNGTTSFGKYDIADYRSTDSSGTIEAWIQLDGVGSSNAIFATADEATTNSSLMFDVVTTGEKSNIRIGQKNAGTWDFAKGNTSLTLNQWYHVVVVSTGSVWKLYVNGKEETLTITGTNTGNWFSDTSNRDNITIGCLTQSSTINYFEGKINKLAIYDSQLSASRILDHYNRGYWG